jgi:hypothetical protein
MKYIKTFESISKPTKYVILKDTFNIERHDDPGAWHNLYGVIVDEGFSKREGEDITYYLVRILSKLDKNFSVSSYNEKDFKPDQVLYNTKKERYDLWVCAEYTEIYYTKKELNKAIKKIEIEKTANKYNL